MRHILTNFLTRRSGKKIRHSLHRRALQGLGFVKHGTMINTGEQGFLERLTQASPASSVYFDVGANKGEYAATLRALKPEAQIFAYEPHPKLIDDLTKRFAGTNVTVAAAALGAKAGTLQLFDSATWNGHGEGASLSQAAAAHTSASEETVAYDVAVATLDAETERLGINHIDFLKVDAEGFDVDVFRGAARFVGAAKVDCVSFEFNDINLKTKTCMADFVAALPGFRFFRVSRHRLVDMGPYSPQTHEIFVWQNVVAFAPHCPDSFISAVVG